VRPASWRRRSSGRNGTTRRWSVTSRGCARRSGGDFPRCRAPHDCLACPET
jgi:hypothetical protein